MDTRLAKSKKTKRVEIVEWAKRSRPTAGAAGETRRVRKAKRAHRRARNKQRNKTALARRFAPLPTLRSQRRRRFLEPGARRVIEERRELGANLGVVRIEPRDLSRIEQARVD
jgi:hypothetical protein